MGRSHRVAVDAFGFDLGAAPPLDRVIDPEDEFAMRRECGDQQLQQDLVRRQSRPSRPIQDSMIVLKMDLLALAHNAQARLNRVTLIASSNCQVKPDKWVKTLIGVGVGKPDEDAFRASSSDIPATRFSQGGLPSGSRFAANVTRRVAWRAKSGQAKLV
jgi:hypothetical protein